MIVNLPWFLLVVAALLASWLVSPIVTEIRAAIIKRRIRRRLHQEQIDWVERRKRHAREVLR